MQNYKVHAYVISMEFSAVNRRRPSRETPLGPGAKKDGCFRRLGGMKEEKFPKGRGVQTEFSFQWVEMQLNEHC